MGDQQQDRETKDTPTSAADVIMTVLWVSTLLCMYFAFRKALGAEDLWPWGAIFGVILAVWLSVLIHELGHAVATILCGWRIVAFAAGFLGIHVANRDFAIVRRSKRIEIAGFVVPVPASSRVWTKSREAWIFAAGPIASLTAAAILLPLSMPGIATLPETGWHATAFGVGLYSLLFGIAALFFSRTGRSDGAQLRALLKRDEAKWRRERAVGYSYALVGHQLRLRDLPPWMVEDAFSITHEDKDVQRITDALQISIALDTRPVAIAHTRELIDGQRCRYGADAWLNSCDAYFTAVWESDPVRARELLWTGDVQREIRPLAFAAEAAVCAAEGNADASRALLEKMHEAMKRKSIFEDRTFRDIGTEIEGVIRSRQLLIPEAPEKKLES